MNRRVVVVGLSLMVLGSIGGVLSGLFFSKRSVPEHWSASDRLPKGPASPGNALDPSLSTDRAPGTNEHHPPTVADGEIRGTVYDMLGEKANGAMIYVVPSGNEALSGNSQFTATAETTGSFVVSGLETGAHFGVRVVFGDQFGTVQCQLTPETPVADVSVVLSLRPVIAGHVVNRDGIPVPAARIQPWQSTGEMISNTMRLTHTVVSDSDGAFLLQAPAPSAWTLYIAADGYSPRFTPPIMAGIRDARVVLASETRMSGQVMVEADGAPGAEVLLRLDGVDLPQIRTQADDDGRFLFPSLSPGTYYLSARLGEYVSLGPSHEVRITTEALDGVLINLERGGIVQGRLIDQATGNGIGGVNVIARSTADPRVRRESGSSDSQGYYEIRGIAEGPHQILPETPSGLRRIGAGGRNNATTVQVRLAQVQDGVDILFARQPVISGRVLDQSGNPVAGAEVRGASKAGWSDRTRSAHDGTFTLTSVEVGDFIQLQASTSKLTSTFFAPLEFPESGLADLELILSVARDGLVAGVVQNSRSEPVQLRVSAWAGEESPDRVPNYAETDLDGRFLLPNLPPGNYDLVGQPGDGNPQTLISLALRPGQQIRGLRLIYESDGLLKLSGKIIDSEGNPVQAALQLFQQAEGTLSHRGSTSTGLEGAFLFSGLRPGDYTISATAQGYSAANAGPFAAGSEDVTIKLMPNPRISGQVSLRSGEPVKSFGVAAVRSKAGQDGAENTQLPYQSVTHPSGQFELSVEPGDYEVIARVEGFGSGRTPVGELVSGSIADDIVVIVEPRKPFRGRVLDADGRPVSGAAIFAGPLPIRPDQAIGAAVARSDVEGYFDVTEPDGNLAPHWSAYHDVAGFGEVLSESPGSDVVTIELNPGASLAVQVTQGGAAVPGGTVYLENPNGKRVVTTHCESDGRAHLSNVPPGEYVLGVVPADGENTATTLAVQLSAGEDAHLRLEVE